MIVYYVCLQLNRCKGDKIKKQHFINQKGKRWKSEKIVINVSTMSRKRIREQLVTVEN